MNGKDPRSLFFANLSEHGSSLENAAYYGLKELREFLQITRDYLENEALLRVGWKNCEKLGPNGSQWVELCACPDRPNEPDATFGSFLDPLVEAVHECSPPNDTAQKRARRAFFRPEYAIRVMELDARMRRLRMERLPELPELAIRPDTYTLDKQIEAIDRLRTEPAAAHMPLLRLFQERRFADRDWRSVQPEPEPKWKVLTDESRDGTLEQRSFVRLALATPDFAFLEGPPGSGKTTAICELILQAVDRGQRVLLSASTHVAVDNVLERIADGRHKEIIAVRIDRRDDEETPDSVKGLRLEQFVKAERRRLREFHREQAQETLAQALFLRGLDAQAEGEEMVERLILDSANLVAGTTIGILQHPDLKKARRAKGTEPQFDLLIVDEASKTTFQEFLVPALWARRWILVGDPRQLSPYADEEDLGPNIRACLREEWKRQVCLAVATAGDRNAEGKALVHLGDDNQRDFLRRQALSRAADTAVAELGAASSDAPVATAFELAGTAIIGGSAEEFRSLEQAVPFDIARLVGPFDAVWHRRRAAWLDHAGIDSEGQGSWENAIAWRLAQDYQMRWSPDDEQPQMWGQIQRLLPVMEEQAVAGGIKRVARLALPSILESLMRGSGGRGNANGRDLITARSDGLRALEPYGRDIFAERSQRLTFQHRMHPDISAMPRRLFYQDEALKDAKGMATSRAWSCDCFGDYRSVWVPVAGTERNNRNEREAQALLQQLTRFLRWAETQPHKDGNGWEVAILTFYRGQEDLLRRCLDRSAAIRIGYGAYIHRNALGRDAASIKLCTVDRFQGHEADVVFLSFVKTRSVGFLRCLNRLNVAITRARYQLVLVGDRDFFGNTQRDSRLLRELATLPAKTTETK